MAPVHSIPARSAYFRYTIKNVPIPSPTADNETPCCLICSDEKFSGHPVQLHEPTACGQELHVFCEDCAVTWFDEQPTCPICRMKLFQTAEEVAAEITADRMDWTGTQPIDLDMILGTLFGAGDEDEDEDPVDDLDWVETTNDMETLVQLRRIGAAHAASFGAATAGRWWHRTGEEPMMSVLRARTELFLDRELVYEPAMFRQEYLSTESRDGMSVTTRYRPDAVALNDRLRDAFFGRFFVALGVHNHTGQTTQRLQPTAAAHPLAFAAYDALRNAINELCPAEGGRSISARSLKQRLLAVGHGAVRRHNMANPPQGIEGYVGDLVLEVVAELTEGEMDEVYEAAMAARSARTAARRARGMASIGRMNAQSGRVRKPGRADSFTGKV